MNDGDDTLKVVFGIAMLILVCWLCVLSGVWLVKSVPQHVEQGCLK